MENTNKIILGLLGLAVIAGGIYYYSKKERSGIKKVTLEKLDLHYIKDFFKQQNNPLKNRIPIVLKVDTSNCNDFNIVMKDNYQYYVVTYYNESNGKISTKNTLIIETESIEINLKDAFGDKDMLVLS